MQHKLIDIIDVDVLQALLDSFTKATGTGTAILDMEGNVLVATGWQDICTQFHRVNPDTASRCLESDIHLASQLEAGQEYNVYRCRNGLVDVAVPIVVDASHVGNLFTGQFFFSPPDEEYFRKQATEFGFDETAYLSALSRVPIFSELQVEETMNFLGGLALTIGKMGVTKLRSDAELTERKRAERELRQSEERFRDLIEGSLEGILIHTEFKLLFANQSCVEMFGYGSIEEMAELSSVLDLVLPSDRALVKQRGIDRARGGDPTDRYEIQCIRKDGSAIWIDLMARTIEWKGETAIQVTTIDITKRKKTEETLRETSAILQAAMDCSPAGIAIADAPDGKLRYVNAAALEIRGKTKEEIVNGVSIDKYVESWQILHFDGSPFAPEEVPLARAILFGETCDEQFVIRRPDQEDRVVWAHAAPVLNDKEEVVAGIVVFPDITNAKRAEEALQQRTHDLDERVKEQQCLFSISEVLSNSDILMDDAFRLIADLIPSGWRFPEATSARISIKDRTYLSRDFLETEWRLTGELVANNNLIGTVEVCCAEENSKLDESPFFVEENKLINVISEMLGRFVERKLASVAEREAKDQAEFANRSKTEFLANMSHELRTPLNTISGSSQILTAEMFGPIDNPKYLEYAKNIQDAGDHLLGVISDLLDISQIETGRFELDEDDVDLNSAIASCHNMIDWRVVEAGLSLKDEVEEALPALRADELRVKQILLNLLSNAVKFTPKGGTVTLKAGTDDEGRVVLSVADTGIGIDADKIDKELNNLGQQTGDPFTREVQGAGIGLPLSKRLVELHGGTLDLESEVGVGTTATVRFPLERVLS